MTSHVPRVSIGMPVYNAENYLGEAIESLLAQTFQDFELIISDNASTDRTEAICREYAARDPRIRYERQAENQGAARNFNHVFERARGPYFKWAAHDDLHSPTFLARCVEVLDRSPDVVWCHPRSTHVGPDGKPLPETAARDVSYSAALSPTSRASEAASAGRSACPPTRESRYPHQRFRAVLLASDSCIDVYGLIRRKTMSETMLHLPYYQLLCNSRYNFHSADLID